MPKYTEAHTKVHLMTPVLRFLILLISLGHGTIVIGRVERARFVRQFITSFVELLQLLPLNLIHSFL